MRDSINYNLNYFIMRMSGTKPLKNTMRKSPIRQEMANNPTELRTNPDVTSTNNNRRGIGVRGKKVSGIQVKSSKTKSPETIAKDSTGYYANKAKILGLKGATSYNLSQTIKYFNASDEAKEDQERQKFKGKKGYDKNGFPIKNKY
jgi:hypothetical protein